MILDPMYWIIVGPTMLLALLASGLVKSAFARYSREPNDRNMSGAEAAAVVLQHAGIHDVGIEESQGYLSDHYDPTAKVLRLSPDVYRGRTVAALAVAAHEAGHAIQDARNYLPMGLRSLAVPVANLGSWLAWPLIIIGLIIGAVGLAKVGILLFAGVVAFQVITLPVEFDASSRAKKALAETRLVTDREAGGVSKVLTAAAMTYVAATITAVAQLLYFLLLVSGRDD